MNETPFISNAPVYDYQRQLVGSLTAYPNGDSVLTEDRSGLPVTYKIPHVEGAKTEIAKTRLVFDFFRNASGSTVKVGELV